MSGVLEPVGEALGVDKWGAALLLSSTAAVSLLLAHWSVSKYRAGRRLGLDPLSSGALRLAAARGAVAQLQLLSVLPGFDVDAAHEGFTALLAAAAQAQPAAAVWLLHHGASVAAQKEDGWKDTALHYSAGRGSLETVHALLAWGADPAAANALGATPADVAEKAGHLAVAQLLQAAAEGHPPEGLPSREELVQRYLSSSDKLAAAAAGSGGAGATQLGARAGSLQLAAAELGDASVQVQTVAGRHVSAALDKVLESPTTSEGQGSSSSSAGKSEQSASLPGPAAAAGDAAAQQKPTSAALAAARQLARRGFEGLGSPGTEPRAEVRLFRPLAVLTQVLGGVYIVWRALRTLHPGLWYAYSIPFWMAEFMSYCLSFCFFTSLWSMIERPQRSVHEMLPAEEVPHVDVYICTYSEPPEIVEPTAIAALNLNWPGSKLTVCILDDGKRPEMARLVRRLAFQCRYMQREANIVYVAREKVKGVPHHAKAGNINSCLLKEGPGKGEYVLILDADMIVHPDFLDRTIGHFYNRADDSSSSSTQQPPSTPSGDIEQGKPPASGSSGGAGQAAAQAGSRWWAPWRRRVKSSSSEGKDQAACAASEGGKEEAKSEGGSGGKQLERAQWVPKSKAAFIQTPQDFFNVDASDPMVHCARFFYGPMLQGRDGIGAAPCCGTGVVFRRDVLVSIGGQSYGSITEDYNTAMSLMSAGMATMYLNERLSFGMAPDDIAGVFTQRLRWAMGALQILMRSNPMRLPGLSFVQSLLFFEAAAHHWLAIPTIFMAIVPIVFLFCNSASPLVAAHIWEFVAFFGVWYMSNRLVMWYVHSGTEGGAQELWRGSQAWIWMAPNHIKAIWKVFISESWLFKKLFNLEIGFTVTKKKVAGEEEPESHWEDLKRALRVTWPHLLYYVALTAGTIYFIVRAALGCFNAWEVMINLSAVGWGLLVALCIWPPIWTLVPRVETEQGWKIKWDVFHHPPTEPAAEGEGEGEHHGFLHRLGDRLSSLQHSLGDRLHSLLPHFGHHEPAAAEQPQPPQQAPGSGGKARNQRMSVDVHPLPRSSLDTSLTRGPPRAGSLPSALDAAPLYELHHHHRVPIGIPETITEGVPEDFSFAPLPAPAGSGEHTSGSLRTPFTAFAQAGALDTTTPRHSLNLQIAPGSEHVAVNIGGLGRGGSLAQAGSLAGSLAQSSGHLERQQSGLGNFGRFGMPRHTSNVLSQSALLTGMILPERSYAAPHEAVNVLLDAEGHTAPGGPVTRGQSRAMSSLLDDVLLEMGLHEHSGSVATSASAGMSHAGSLALPRAQSQALARLQSLTGAHVELPASPPRHGSGGRRGRRSMQHSGGATRQVSLVADELPTISNVVLGPRPRAQRQLPPTPAEEEPLPPLPPSQASVKLERAATLAPQGNWQVSGWYTSSGSTSPSPFAADVLSPFGITPARMSEDRGTGTARSPADTQPSQAVQPETAAGSEGQKPRRPSFDEMNAAAEAAMAAPPGTAGTMERSAAGARVPPLALPPAAPPAAAAESPAPSSARPPRPPSADETNAAAQTAMAARPAGSGGETAGQPIFGGVAASSFGGAAASPFGQAAIASPFGAWNNPRASRDIVRRSLEAVRMSMERVGGSGASGLPLSSGRLSGSWAQQASGRFSGGSGGAPHSSGRLSGGRISSDAGRLSLDAGRLSLDASRLSLDTSRLSIGGGVRHSRDGSSRRLPRLSLQLITPFTALAQQGFSDEEEDDDFSVGSGMESEDAELVEQLAAEAAADLADRGTVPGTMSRVRQLSQQLVDIAASLSPENASMLLERGYSMCVPVVPSSVYEHTLVARPNFQLREAPPSSYMYFLVNAALLVSMVAAAVLEQVVR